MTRSTGIASVVVCDLCGLTIGSAPESRAARLTLGCPCGMEQHRHGSGVSFDVCSKCEAILAASINSLFNEARNGRKA